MLRKPPLLRRLLGTPARLRARSTPS